MSFAGSLKTRNPSLLLLLLLLLMILPILLSLLLLLLNLLLAALVAGIFANTRIHRHRQRLQPLRRQSHWHPRQFLRQYLHVHPSPDTPFEQALVRRHIAIIPADGHLHKVPLYHAVVRRI